MKKRNKNWAFYLVISFVAVLAVGLGVYAYSSSHNVNVQGDYNFYESQGQPTEEPSLGASPGGDMHFPVTFYDDVTFDPSGSELFSAGYASLTQEATSTVANPQVAAKIFNRGKPKLCLAPELYIKTANGLFGSNWAVGTTTLSGHISLTATSTATLIASHAVTTSTTGIIGNVVKNKGTGYGTATTSEPWIWGTDVALVAYSDHSGATSSDSYISSGGFTKPVAGLSVWCWTAY